MKTALTRCVFLLVCVCLGLHGPGGFASARGAFNRPFSLYAEKQDLAEVLTSFARSQGYSAVISPALGGAVSGRFQAVSPSNFLGGMHAAYGVSWYARGGELHFYNENEKTSAVITARTMDPAALHRSLVGSGLASEQLPVRFAQGVIQVSGPPRYVNDLVLAAQALESTQERHNVTRVFPLQYAWADDMTVNSMDKTVTIPGVASILRAMLGQGAESGTTMVQQQAAAQSKLSGTGLIAQGRPAREQNAERSAAPADDRSGERNLPVSVMADPRVNSVIVTDAAYRMPYYEKVIRDLDKAVDLVEIHAAIVDIDVENTRDLGVSYQGASSRRKNWSVGGEFAPGPGETSVYPTPGTFTNTGLSLSTIYSWGTDFFLARVTALEASGAARVLGKPSVLTVDNVQATLENTTTYYVTVEGYQATDLYKVEAGTVLRVTPHIINENGQTVIKLAVNVQDAQNPDSAATVTGGSPPPPIKQTTINTQAVVGEGESLLIGGYYYEKKSEDVSGIPILMHLPVLGHLFKTTSRASRRMERLILITPKVIRSGERASIPGRVDEKSFRQTPTQADYEEREPPKPFPVSTSGCMRRAGGAVPAPDRAGR